MSHKVTVTTHKPTHSVLKEMESVASYIVNDGTAYIVAFKWNVLSKIGIM